MRKRTQFERAYDDWHYWHQYESFRRCHNVNARMIDRGISLCWLTIGAFATLFMCLAII